MKKIIKKILIANRGEIAVRVMRACRDLEINSVAVYSECDKSAYHVRMADEACHIGASPAAESYLDQDKIIDAAKKSGVDAIHPGYGFLSENADFAQRCENEGLIFIGPTPASIRLLGDKLKARQCAVDAGLTVLPGLSIRDNDQVAATKAGKEIGFPLLIKAAAGGGGKGMRVVNDKSDLKDAISSASREAKSTFGDGRVFIEKYLTNPRHIEIQILCDNHGRALHLGERECSIQRRHQKVIEESPSPAMTDELRNKMGQAALAIAKSSNYVGAGTVEFLMDSDKSFYFLEVNTRLQVEHAVTEMVTGIDLVKEQIAIARGTHLNYEQEDITSQGHAIEFRIYAEDPEEGFIPSTGKLKNYRAPAGPGVRVDSGVVIFSDIPIYYDPMIAKLIVWGKDRIEAIMRARRALDEYRISGVRTTIGFHRTILRNKRFLDGHLSTNFLSKEYPNNNYHEISDKLAEQAAIAAAIDMHSRDRKIANSFSTTSGQTISRWQLVHRERALKQFDGKR